MKEEIDKLCDVLWWLKGFRAGANNDWKNCPFDETYLLALNKAIPNEKELSFGAP